jgi:uncharacterized membrane protein YeaQ/YmgE (transglycosylase-associated protein family)
MKKSDVLFGSLALAIALFLIVPVSRGWFETATLAAPYPMGFLKTAVLASMGELLADRIRTKRYFARKGFLMRALVWGLLGLLFVLAFTLFSRGTLGAIDSGILPSVAQPTWLAALYGAFLTSVFMNLFFAPSFMILHRFTDAAIEASQGSWKKLVSTRWTDLIGAIDWKRFFGFVVFQTIPFFWIPAHTVTFLLPPEYRVLMAGLLSIALGFLLAQKQSRKKGS